MVTLTPVTVQVVWDVATHTLHFEVGRLLDQHRRYGVIVTREVLDTRGKHVKQTEGFENHAITVPPWYATQIDEAPPPCSRRRRSHR